MKLTAYDFNTDNQIDLTAELTTDHPASSYSQAVMIIKEWNDDVMSHQNFVLARCKVKEIGDNEVDEFNKWFQLIEMLAGEVSS